MRTVHIGICHNNNFVIPQFRNIKVISVSFRKSAAESINHRLDFRICQNFVYTRLLHIQNLTTNRQNRLKLTVSRRFRRTARGISLHDENFTFACVPAFTVCKFSITVKRIFLLCQKVCLCLLFCLSNFCRLFRTGQYFFQRIEIFVKEACNLIICHLACRFSRVLIIQFCFCLSLKPRIRVFYRYDCRHSVSYIRPRKVGIFFFQHTYLSRILIHYHCKCRLKSRQMCAAFRIINIVTKSKHVFMKFIYILKGHFHFYSVCLSFKIDWLMNGFLFLIQICYKSKYSVWFMIFNTLRLCSALILKNNRKCRIQIRSFMESALYLFRFKSCLFKYRIVRKKIYGCPRFLGLCNNRKKPVH